MRALDLPAGDGPLDVLCIGAHADDIEIGCGGTLLTLQALRPVRLRWLVFSGTGERAREAREGARRLTARAESVEVDVLSFRDGSFPYEAAEIKEFFRELGRTVRPDLVFTHDERDLHQDHSTLGRLTRETFRDHLTLSYEIPKWDGGLRSPNVFVPLDEDVVGAKVDAILDVFTSQRGKHWLDEDLLRGLMRLRGVECASPTRFAEGFHGARLRLFG